MTARWLPNFAICLSLVTLFYCLVLFDAPQQFFRDSDAGWHLTTGERILNSFTLPRNDPYSFTRLDAPWVSWEWGADVLMAATEKVVGLRGVVLLFASAILFVSWLWVQLNWAAGGNFFLTALFAAPMLSTTNLHWLARPHVFSWVFLLAFLWYFESARGPFRWRDAVVIGLGTVLWANLHASFFLLPVIAGIYALGRLATGFLWPVEDVKARWYGLAALVSLLASLINPYGWALHAHLIRYLADGELLDRVAEFQSFNYHVDGAFQILLMLGFAAVGGVLALSQKNVAHFLLTVLFLAIALRSARGLPVAALLLLPLANGAITRALREVTGLRPKVAEAIRSFLTYSGNLRALDKSLSGTVWVPVALLLASFFLSSAKTGFPPDQFPVQSAALLPALPQPVRLFAPDKFGGYLIHRFHGTIPVFFDGRSDFYGSGFMKDYIRIVEVRPGWREKFEGFRCTHALLPVEYSLVPALQEIGWRTKYQDKVAVLLERP